MIDLGIQDNPVGEEVGKSPRASQGPQVWVQDEGIWTMANVASMQFVTEAGSWVGPSFTF